jgi:hypothetical protein
MRKFKFFIDSVHRVDHNHFVVFIENCFYVSPLNLAVYDVSKSYRAIAARAAYYSAIVTPAQA